MKIIYTSDGFETFVDDEDYDFLMEWTWRINGWGYCQTWAKTKNGVQKSLLMHQEVAKRAGISVKNQVDHKDRNKLNNQRGNLRAATISQNRANAPARTNNLSGYKGVSWHVRRQCYAARVRKDQKLIHLGYFDSAIEAARQYDCAARRLFGEFACLNFPEEK